MSSCAAASTGTSSGRRLRTSPGCGTRPTSSSRNPNDQRNQNLDQNLHLQYACSLSELGWAKPTNLPPGVRGYLRLQRKPKTKTISGLFMGRRALPGPEGVGTNFAFWPGHLCDLPRGSRGGPRPRRHGAFAKRAPFFGHGGEPFARQPCSGPRARAHAVASRRHRRCLLGWKK